MHAGSPGWCRASAFMSYWLFLGQSAGVVLVSRATLFLVQSSRASDEDMMAGGCWGELVVLCQRPDTLMGLSLLAGALLASVLLGLGELGSSARLLCLHADSSWTAGDVAASTRWRSSPVDASPAGILGATMALTGR